MCSTVRDISDHRWAYNLTRLHCIHSCSVQHVRRSRGFRGVSVQEVSHATLWRLRGRSHVFCVACMPGCSSFGCRALSPHGAHAPAGTRTRVLLQPRGKHHDILAAVRCRCLATSPAGAANSRSQLDNLAFLEAICPSRKVINDVISQHPEVLHQPAAALRARVDLFLQLSCPANKVRSQSRTMSVLAC